MPDVPPMVPPVAATASQTVAAARLAVAGIAARQGWDAAGAREVMAALGLLPSTAPAPDADDAKDND